MIDFDHFQFIGAVHRRPRPEGVDPTLIVLHDGETGEGPTAAEGMAAYFASGNTLGSAHICVDNNSIVRCALDTERCNGAGGANADGLHIEQAGRAAQGPKDWADDYSQATIKNAVAVAQAWVARWHIQRRFLTAATLKAGERNGITTHRECTLAGFAGNDGHSDPGASYPIAQFMTLLGGSPQTGDEMGMLVKAPDHDAVFTLNIGTGTYAWTASPKSLGVSQFLAGIGLIDAKIHPLEKEAIKGYQLLGAVPPGW